MYCAYVTRIHNLRKHTNADRLLCGECFGNTVIVDLGTDPDQLGVYFPTDGKLGLEFAQKNDLLRLADTLTRRSGILRLSSSGARRATVCSSLSPVWLLLPISRSSKRAIRSLC